MTNLARDEACLRFAEWAKQSDISCMFARMMFLDPGRYGLSELVLRASDPSVAAKTLALEVDKSTALPAHEGIFAYFPDVCRERDIRGILDALANQPGWSNSVTLLDRGRSVLELYHLRVAVGRDGSGPCSAEVVAFAPLDSLPTSRRGPFLCLAIRSKPQGSLDPAQDGEERRANLAAIPTALPKAVFDRVWQKTVDLRASNVGKSNPVARARNTIAFTRANQEI